MSIGDENILVVTDLCKRFGGVFAVNKVSFGIPRGSIVALIGPNGAGKTTLFNTIAGVYVPNSGSIQYESQEIAGKRPHAVTRFGIARTFQIVRPFLKMACLENVMVGAMFGNAHSVNFKVAREGARRYLNFVGLEDKKDLICGNLTLVDRKMVEVAKALACNPKLILLDEPLAGLNPTEVQSAMGLIRKIRSELGITVFWVEHVMDAVMNVADHIIVLNYGEKIAEESPSGLLSNKKVIDAYLGEEFTF